MRSARDRLRAIRTVIGWMREEAQQLPGFGGKSTGPVTQLDNRLAEAERSAEEMIAIIEELKKTAARLAGIDVSAAIGLGGGDEASR